MKKGSIWTLLWRLQRLGYGVRGDGALITWALRMEPKPTSSTGRRYMKRLVT